MNEKTYIRQNLRGYLYADALLHNVSRLKNCCAENVKFCAVVKANAYGHGISEVVNILKDADVDFFAVASVYEAFCIAGSITKQRILVLDPLSAALPDDVINRCAQLGLHMTVSSLEAAKYASSALSGSSAELKVHVNINTGMGRCGVHHRHSPPPRGGCRRNGRCAP